MKINFEDLIKIFVVDIVDLENKFRIYNKSNKSYFQKPLILKFFNTNISFLIFDKKYPIESVITLNRIEKNQLDIFYNSLKIIKTLIISYQNDRSNFEKYYNLIERQLVILIRLIKIKNLYPDGKKSFFFNKSNAKKDGIFDFIELLETNILKWKKENEAIISKDLTLDSKYLKFIKIIIDGYDEAYLNISKPNSAGGQNLFFEFDKSINVLKKDYLKFENNTIDKSIFLKRTLNEINNIFNLNSSQKKSFFSIFARKKVILKSKEVKLKIWNYQKLINQLINDFKRINQNNFLDEIHNILDFYKSKKGMFLDSSNFKLGGLNKFEEGIWKKNIINSLENFEKDFNLFSKNNGDFNSFSNNINSMIKTFLYLKTKIDEEIPLNSQQGKQIKNKVNSYVDIVNGIQNYPQLIIQVQNFLNQISKITADAYKVKYILKLKDEKINFLNQNKNSVLTYLFKLNSEEERFNYYIKNINPSISMLRIIFEKDLLKRLYFRKNSEKIIFENIKKQIEFISSNLSLVKNKQRSIPNLLADIEIARINISKVIQSEKPDPISTENKIVSKPNEKIINLSSKKVGFFERILSSKLKKSKQKIAPSNLTSEPKKIGFFSSFKKRFSGKVQFQMYVSLNLKNKFEKLERGDIISNIRNLLKLKEFYKIKKFKFNNDSEKEAYGRILHILNSLENRLKDYDENKIDIHNFNLFVRNVVVLFKRINSSSVNPNMDFNHEYNPI